MNPEQALQILKNVSNLCIANGGILTSIDEAASVSVALQTLRIAIEPRKTPNPESGE